MKKYQEYYTNGCVALIGAVVKVAIQDVAKTKSLGETHPDVLSAKAFLFDEGRMGTFFKKYYLAEYVNCDYIRREAEDIIEGRKELEDVELIKK